jgi:succinate dehydrogenase / fumarate reductase flavoprotein subunit
LQRPFEGGGTENPYTIHEDLQAAMAQHAGIARTGDGLREGLNKVLALQERCNRLRVGGSMLFNPGWHECRDVRFMLTLAEAIFRCAIEREESRGSHWRLDFPEQNPEWGRKNLIAVKDGGRMVVRTHPVPQMPPELERLVRGETVVQVVR